MFRAAFITVVVVGLSDVSASRGQEPDPIKANLEKAKATYAADMVVYRKAVLDYFDKRVDDALTESVRSSREADLQKYAKGVAEYFDTRESDARKIGDKKQVDQIKAERKAFEEKGDLPVNAPPGIKKMQNSARMAKQAIDAQQALIVKIKLERKAFEESGVLPTWITFGSKTLTMMPLAAATKLEAAYVQAIKEYTKIRKDDEATAVEKELDKLFKEMAAAVVASSLPEAYRTRNGAAKLQAIKANGGTAETEKAVSAALEWLAKQQNPAGFWEFDGNAKADRIAATGMCLLPFLAAGEMPIDGKYKVTVAKGLNWLKSQMRQGGQLGSSGMYSQPIATIALCEAAGMTQDKAMQNVARAAVNFVMTSQGVNGSWGYTAGTEGDTSIVGWNIQALKSGKLAGIPVPDKVFKQAEAFLNSVSSDSGASYGYRGPGATHTLSSVGLLCRYYMGWGPQNPSFARGVGILAGKFPPQKNDFNMYYYYYATQVVHFFGGEDWTKWNLVMRQMLMDLQITQKTPNAKAADLGSWPKDNHFIGSECGKLGSTALSALTLQVYYRHPPLPKPKIQEKDEKKKD